jgi:uncharacterized protein
VRWIESSKPISYVESAGPRPNGVTELPSLRVEPCGAGHLLINSDSGGWVEVSTSELDALERSRRAACDDIGSSALDALWERGVLHVDGRHSRSDLDLGEAVEAQRTTSMLVLLLNEGCNLVCGYCYLGHATPSRAWAMDTDVARRAVDALFRQPYPAVHVDFGEIAVAEPLFRQLVEHVAEKRDETGRAVTMSIQTNGTTLDDELADFLARHAVSAGISVDGPALLHDAARTFRSGRGSHEQAVAAIERCRVRGISVHVPVTIARHNVVDVIGVLEEVASLRPGSFLLKPVLAQGEAAADWEASGVTVAEYAAFMTAAVAWAADTDVDLLDTTATKFLKRLLGDVRGWGDGCTSRHCSSGRALHVVDRHGNQHACPRYVTDTTVHGLTIGTRPPKPSGESYALGALLDPGLRTAPTTCEGCGWLRSCGGGCTLAGQDGDRTVPRPDPHCHAYDAIHRELTRLVLPKLLDGAWPEARITQDLTVREQVLSR